ncbi:ABC transporter permease [Ampullimonas aquatilis]|uniref:ABC transporter permease n=1 Tax=Ampullimonas aquatilis TaxID=1341549 RepID=UPI003C71A785
MQGFWRLPGVSLRFIPVWQRNLLVWKKLAWPSVLANVAEPLISLVAFGYGLGAILPSIQGEPYVRFLASGYICTSIMNSATFETLYSTFSRMHAQRTWDSLLNAPLDLDDIVTAEWVWAATKSVMSGCAILLVLVVLNISRAPTLLLTLPLFVLVGLTFAGMGLVINAIARGYDFFSYYITLVMTPMMFLSGVFFPISQLPGWLQTVAQYLPLKAAIDLIRPLVLGHFPDAVIGPICILLAYGLGGFYLAVALTRRRLLQ